MLYRTNHGELPTVLHSVLTAHGTVLAKSSADGRLRYCAEIPQTFEDSGLSRPLVDGSIDLAWRCVLSARRLESVPTSTFPPTHG